MCPVVAAIPAIIIIIIAQIQEWESMSWFPKKANTVKPLIVNTPL